MDKPNATILPNDVAEALAEVREAYEKHDALLHSHAFDGVDGCYDNCVGCRLQKVFLDHYAQLSKVTVQSSGHDEMDCALRDRIHTLVVQWEAQAAPLAATARGALAAELRLCAKELNAALSATMPPVQAQPQDKQPPHDHDGEYRWLIADQLERSFLKTPDGEFATYSNSEIELVTKAVSALRGQQ